MTLAQKILTHIHWLFFVFTGIKLYFQYTDYTEQIKTISQSRGITTQQIEKQTANQNDATKLSKEIENAKEKIAKINDEITSLQKRLPASISEGEDIQSFQSIAENLNMKDISIVSHSEVLEDFYSVKHYELKAKATYLQFLLFFEKIARLQRIFNMRSLQLTLPEEETRGRFQLVDGTSMITSYQYKPNNKKSQEQKE